ncbi:MAG: aminotransferase class V-fold PLP-dependent enzyme [Gammaproteobacteria bacterium]|nr:aminotransferase class V-fold PLP-dependent enzyme [Gammaproteobacteria bacterium]
MTTAAPIYLDHAATAPLDPQVAAAICECLRDPGLQGNAASVHAPGRAAAVRVEQARAQVARLVGAEPGSIVFTSGATESVNLAILGAARAAGANLHHLVTARTEHRAALDACRQLEREGFAVSWLATGSDGSADPAQVASALRPGTALVSLMHANNETGVINDIAAVGQLCLERGVTFHVDAAQSAGKLPIDVQAMNVALLSFCAHKLGGPKGIGALYVRHRPRPALQPLQFGGGHERGLRAGSLATHQIVGFGVACELALTRLADDAARVRALRERLWAGLQAAAPVERNGGTEPGLPGILNVRFPGIEGESLLLSLDGRLAASSGSACSSASAEPSYVLRALGLSDLAAQASLRLSLGRATTGEEVDRAAALLVASVNRLRALLPAGAIERIA